MVGVNDLLTTHPHTAAEWHPTKNDRSAQEVTHGSTYAAWWLVHGHEWQAIVNNRSDGSGCAVCRGLYAMPGVNDLLTASPDIAAQWHSTKNDLHPTSVTVSSMKKVWWYDHGHEWVATVANRTAGQGCAVCHGKQVMVGVNDLASVNPEVASEWHPFKNTKQPHEVSFGSDFRAYWLCSKGHEWDTAVKSRNRGTDCPHCAKALGWGTSHTEQRLRRFLAAHYPGTHPEGVLIPRMDGSARGWLVDVLIEAESGTKAVIEYDGHQSHALRCEFDSIKSAALRDMGYTVVRVRPGTLPLLHPHDVHVPKDWCVPRRAGEVAQEVIARLTSLGIAPAA